MPVPEPLSQSEFSIGSVWKKAWTTFTERFRGIIALTLIPWIIIMIAIIIVVVLSVGSTSFFSNLFPGSPVSLILPVIFGVACVFFAFIVILRSQIGLIFLISGQQTTPWTAFKAAKGKVLSYLWVTILGALVTYGGFVLLIIPGIYIAVAVVFAYIVCVMEGDKGLGALVKSREYVRGRWWKVFGYMASVVVIGLFVNILLSLFGDKGVIGITFSILSVLFQIMYGAFFVVFLFTLYGELKSSRPEIGTMVVQKKKTGYVILAILGVLAPLAIISVMAASLPFAFSALQGNGYFVESTEPTMVSERALALTIPAGFVKIPSPEGYAIYGSDNGVLILKSADMRCLS